MALIRSKQLSKSFEGDIQITGSLTVSGQSTFIQTSSVRPAIIVSGSEYIVSNQYSGSLFIQGLGVFANTGSNAIIDLGDQSF